MTLLEDDICDLLPLFRGRIDAGRIVCTRMEQEDGALRSGTERVYEAYKVESDRLGIVIGVVYRVDANVLEDREVVN